MFVYRPGWLWHNCTDGDSDDYGLSAWESSSSIHLASSLTIEMISTNNAGGGNHGGEGYNWYFFIEYWSNEELVKPTDIKIKAIDTISKDVEDNFYST